MKTKFKLIILVVAMAGLFASCNYDNYDEPGSFLEGNIVYNGEAINVSSKDVSFQLWEPGWQKSYPINVEVAQDGSYSSLLFNAQYKLVIPSNQGPWRTKLNSESGSDTIYVNLNGNKTMDIEVEPYFMVRNPQFSASGSNVTATFQAEKIITDAGAKNIERVNFYVNKTQFVDFRSSSNVASAEIGGGDITNPASISMSLTVPELVPAQGYVYGRVGIKIQGVEDMIFSPVQKIDL
jgi:hypothetical protein